MSEQNMYYKVDQLVELYGSKKESLIPIIQDIQAEFHYIPKELLSYIASRIGITESKAYGVATFYENFSFEPKGKYIIKVCDGTACHVRKSISVLERIYNDLDLSKEKNTTDDKLFTVETVSCLGACGLAPVVMVNETVHPAMTPDSVTTLLKKIREEEANE